MITGPNHFCGIREDSWSGMWCAGNNSYGQLLNWATATGSFMGQCQNAPNGGYYYFNVNLPNGEKVDVNRLTDEWSQQYNSTMVISTTGKVYGSGRNEFGKLGSDTLGDAGNSFRQCVAQEFTLPAGVTAENMSTRDEYTTYVLGSDGKIYASGRNNNGQIGDTTTTDRLSPVEVKIPRQATNY
jgi:alpha-tubulin suppressor-like RCC1 family protein